MPATFLGQIYRYLWEVRLDNLNRRKAHVNNMPIPLCLISSLSLAFTLISFMSFPLRHPGKTLGLLYILPLRHSSKGFSCCQAVPGAGLVRDASISVTVEMLLVIQRLGSAFAHLGRLETSVTLVRAIFLRAGLWIVKPLWPVGFRLTVKGHLLVFKSTLFVENCSLWLATPLSAELYLLI